MSEHANRGGVPGWFTRWSDPTAQTIVRIDRELAQTEQQRDLIQRFSLCLVCGKAGLHPHVIPPGSAE